MHVLISLMVEVASTSETSVNFYRTSRCNNSEDSHLDLHTRCCKNLKSFLVNNYSEDTFRRSNSFETPHRPDDGYSKYLRNVGKQLPDYTAQHPTRQPSSDYGSFP
jgi:hypothetical protein